MSKSLLPTHRTCCRSTLDKPRYKPGETAHVNLTPRFSGTALVMVVGDRLIDMKAVEVEAGGTTVDLEVDESWGAGAYVTATVFRPMDVAASRMPGRAIGLQWLNLDMTARTTSVELDVPDIVRPEQPLDVLVKLPTVAPGERALVTLAAVDVGILNLTGYKPPAPQDWYFGQRALGVEFRDLYGQLIDGMQGPPAHPLRRRRSRHGHKRQPAGAKAGCPVQRQCRSRWRWPRDHHFRCSSIQRHTPADGRCLDQRRGWQWNHRRDCARPCGGHRKHAAVPGAGRHLPDQARHRQYGRPGWRI